MDAPPPPLARVILAHGLLVGVAADLLIRDGDPGIAFPLWFGIIVIAITSMTWRDRRELPREAVAWLMTALLFSAGLAWRDSDMLQALDVFATIGSLAMAGISLGNGRAALLAERFRDTVWAATALAKHVALGFAPLAVRELFATDTRGRMASRARSAGRSILIGGSVLLVFGSLLRGADPIFASLLELPHVDMALIASHLFIIGFYSWLVSGWARGAFGTALQAKRAPDSLPFGLSLLDITTALGTLNALFAAFVVAQLGWFFGGESFLHARTGLTAAQYARQGFFEMVWVVLLVVPLLVATRAALQPGQALQRRHTLLSLPIIALLGAIIFSAVTRMQLYVHYFGLTVDRFYPLVFMGWLGLVLVWLALTVLRGQGRTFVAGVAVSGLAVLAALNAIAPDAIVAQFNIDRAATTQRLPDGVLDLKHMSELSADAAPLATRATLRAAPSSTDGTPIRAAEDEQQCEAARTLLRRWGPSSEAVERQNREAAWRSWNAGEVNAIRYVTAHSAELRTAQHAACANVRKPEHSK
ncbi:MAG: DUF4173 domain-containing protein [bacterium]